MPINQQKTPPSMEELKRVTEGVYDQLIDLLQKPLEAPLSKPTIPIITNNLILNARNDAKNFGTSTTLFTMMSLISDYLPPINPEPVKFAEKPNEASPWIQGIVNAATAVQKLTTFPSLKEPMMNDTYTSPFQPQLSPFSPLEAVSSYDAVPLPLFPLPEENVSNALETRSTLLCNWNPLETPTQKASHLEKEHPFYMLLGQVDGLDLQTPETSNESPSINGLTNPQFFSSPEDIQMPFITTEQPTHRSIAILSSYNPSQVSSESLLALKESQTADFVKSHPLAPLKSVVSSGKEQKIIIPNAPTPVQVLEKIAAPLIQEISVAPLPTAAPIFAAQSSLPSSKVKTILTSEEQIPRTIVTPTRELKSKPIANTLYSSSMESAHVVNLVPKGQLSSFSTEKLGQSRLEQQIQTQQSLTNDLLRLEIQREIDLKLQKQEQKQILASVIATTPQPPPPSIKNALISKNEISLEISVNGKEVTCDVGRFSSLNTPSEIASLTQSIMRQLETEYDPEGLWSPEDITQLQTEIQQSLAQIVPENLKNHLMASPRILGNPISLAV